MRIPAADAYAPPELLPEHADRCCARPVDLEQEVTDLFEQLRNPLFRYLLSLGVSTQDGEEVIQEVFLALFQHLKNGKPRDNLRGWIFRVGHNQALKLRQRHGGRPAQPEGGAVDGRPDPEQQALQNQRQERLSAVIRALPKRDRACLALRAEGIRYREIAEILCVSLGAVALSLGRSLAKLSCVQER
jgi:RNA polymerase sigma-70 factor (ECF subfamily)